jgi:YD repeat-containing protein
MRRVLRTPSVRAGRVLLRSKTRLARVGSPRRLAGLLALSLSLPAAWLLAPVALGSSTSEPEAGSGRPASSEVQIVRELVGLRTATSDTFLRSDGSRLARVYPTPVNYRAASGEWVPIDDTLQRAPTGWETAASPTPVTLPSSLASSPVTVGPPGRSVGFVLEGASASEGQNAGPSMSYTNAQSGVNVSYSVSSEGVREVLSLASAAAPTVYRYKLTYAAGLRPELTSAGGVAFKDTTGKVAYTMAPPTVTDASPGAQLPSTSAVHYELSGDGSLLSLVLDKSWLEDPRRVFPVQVDPDIYFYEQSDCSIASSSYANSNLCGGPLYVGANTETPKSVSRSMLQFNLASIPRDANVLYSRLGLWFKADSTTSPIEIEANGLTRNFTQAATWNKYDGTNAWTTPGGDFATTMSGKQTILDSYKNYWVNWGFAPLVQQWIQEPASNHGVLLKSRNETVSGYDEFLRVNNSEKTDEPNLEIAYATRTGINEGDSILGDELAAGGEVAVNAANGNLLVTSPDVNYQGEGYETHLTRDYNSQDENLTGSSFGSGWVLNTGSNTLLYPAWWDRSYAFHEPGGGWTRFDPTPPSNSIENQSQLKYVAQPGLNATLVAHEDGTRTVTFNETGTEWLFDKSGNGFPQKIVEGTANTLSLGYTESRLTHMTDTHGHELTVTLDPSTHHVTKVQNVNGEHWEYGYNASHQLTSYKDNEGHEAKYGYTSTSGVVNEITDTTGTYVISYDTKGRVTALRKLVNGTVKEAGSEDEITSYEYKKPESPTCKPATDTAETVVSYKPAEATETYCFDASDHVTGPKSASEEEAEEAPETTETQEEIAAGTCFDEATEWNDCELEEAPPEPEEDLRAENYGIADNNWLIGKAEHEASQGGEKIVDPIVKFNYFPNTYFKNLKVHYLRRTMPWNTVIQAKYDEEYPEHENAQKEKVAGFDPGARARRNDTEHWVEEAKAQGAQPIISFERCPEKAQWTNPVFEAERAEATRAREREAKEHKPAPEATSLEEHAEKVESCETPPRRKSYEYAVKLFNERTAFAGVTHLTAWNEPNNKSQSTYHHAEIAGQLWRVLDDLCVKRVPACQVAAGDFSDSYMGNADAKTSIGGKYFAAYVHGTGRPTTLYKWAWHAYTDGVETQAPKKRYRPATWWKAFKSFRAAVDATVAHPRCGACQKPKIWLSEQGVLFFKGSKPLGPVIGKNPKGESILAPLWENWNLAEGVMNAYVGRRRMKPEPHQLSTQGQVSLFMDYQMQGAPSSWDSGLLETSEALPGKLKPKAKPELPRERLYKIYEQKTLYGG